MVGIDAGDGRYHADRHWVRAILSQGHGDHPDDEAPDHQGDLNDVSCPHGSLLLYNAHMLWWGRLFRLLPGTLYAICHRDRATPSEFSRGGHSCRVTAVLLSVVVKATSQALMSLEKVLIYWIL